MVSVQVKCPSCQGEWVYRHGQARNGLQRYRFATTVSSWSISMKPTNRA
ncbi:IS1 family transposase [Thiothrix eikelboomii]